MHPFHWGPSSSSKGKGQGRSNETVCQALHSSSRLSRILNYSVLFLCKLQNSAPIFIAASVPPCCHCRLKKMTENPAVLLHLVVPYSGREICRKLASPLPPSHSIKIRKADDTELHRRRSLWKEIFWLLLGFVTIQQPPESTPANISVPCFSVCCLAHPPYEQLNETLHPQNPISEQHEAKHEQGTHRVTVPSIFDQTQMNAVMPEIAKKQLSSLALP